MKNLEEEQKKLKSEFGKLKDECDDEKKKAY